MSVHFSSLRLDWKTPKAVYQVLDAEFQFDCDPCPADNQFDYRTSGGQELLPLGGFETEHDVDTVVDGLKSSWGGVSFVNPPYGNELPKWIAKGFAEWQKGKTVVFLIPSRTDTRWWHDYVMKATEIRFIRGRLKFGDQAGSAPFPSAIIVFKAKV